MQFLLVTQYYWPEPFLIHSLVEHLVKQGNGVTVLTGKPNYPDGNVFPGYQQQGLQEEDYKGLARVARVPLRPRNGGGGKNLLLNYLSFITSGLRYFPGLVKGQHFDVILVFAPSPITSAIPAIWLKWLKGTHLAIWVQDLWPESLGATGFVRSPLLRRVVGWLVRGIYACTDTLLIQSRAFHEPVARYANREKIVYYPNAFALSGTESSDADPLPPELAEVLDNSFCAVFAGNLGTAQSIETLVKAAVHLQKHPQCKLVLVGSGCMLDWAKARKAELGLDNLILAGRYPMSMMPQIFARAGALIVNLRGDEIFSYTVPSKLQAYLAAGRPIIAALNGEGARIVLEAGAGTACPAEDAVAMAHSIQSMAELTPGERDRMGAAGKDYFLQHFEITAQAKRLVDILDRRMANNQRSGN
ncbi:MAG: glycosyltransferase WbuB [Halomonadaceae bacterium]|nr:MAG: glycosyltransferase WbuB [Halomonadaceae bacterium]